MKQGRQPWRYPGGKQRPVRSSSVRGTRQPPLAASDRVVVIGPPE